jgi:hypothetical protein
MTRVLRHLQRRVVTVAPYEALLGSTQLAELVVWSSVRHLRDDLVSHVKPASLLIPPDPALRRNRVCPGDHEQQMSLRQLELWGELAALGPGEQRIDVPEKLLECGPAVLRLVRAETERQALQGRLQEAVQASAAEAQRSAALSLELVRERERIRALSVERPETAAAALLRAEAWLEAIQTSWSWRITAPLRACKRAVRRPLARRNGP